MPVERNGNSVRADFSRSGSDTCKDNFRFKLVERAGRFYFEDVRIGGAAGCRGHAETLMSFIEGRALDEIPLDRLDRIECDKPSSCPREVAGMIREIRDLIG